MAVNTKQTDRFLNTSMKTYSCYKYATPELKTRYKETVS